MHIWRHNSHIDRSFKKIISAESGAKKGFPMDLELNNKVALVTGASSGIGKATAQALCRQGARVVLVGRSRERLQEAAQDMPPEGHRLEVADITQAAETQAILDRVAADWGGLDILVNAAGIIGFGNIETESLEQWKEMMQVNLYAPFILLRQALPQLTPRRGAVVNVSSVTGLRAFPNLLSYCVSKAAVDQLTRCTALELAPKGIRVNAVNPGVVLSGLHLSAGMDAEAYRKFIEHSQSTHPLGRVGQASEVADLILFLVSPRSGWITGMTCSIDGGRHLTCLR
jgi:NAD(P)-dependent dehydrogenase (short-subunit alcohol dehydrogenase family)